MTYWNQPEKIALLVSLAQEMSDRYQGQTIASIGHSPSWLTYTVGQVRKDRGEAANVAYIPFSGSNLEHVSFEPSVTDPAIHNTVFELKKGAGHDAGRISNYFNKLNKSQRAVLGLDGAYDPSAPKVVLTDMAEKGCGFAHFANVLAHHTGQPDLSQRFDAHLFKQYFNHQAVNIVIENGDAPDTVLRSTVQSDETGMLLTSMSGAQGIWDINDNAPLKERGMGRFMPLFNPEKHDRPIATKMTSGAQIKELKHAIGNMIARSKTHEGQTFMATTRTQAQKWSPDGVSDWLSGYFPHGGCAVGIKSQRQLPPRPTPNAYA